MTRLMPLKSAVTLIAVLSLCASPVVLAKEPHYRSHHYSHGHKSHHQHHHYRHYSHNYGHHHHHDGAALIGGAILGAVIVSAFDHHHPEQVTVIQQGYAAPSMIYRQLADGSCYRVSYDANGTEYLQKIHTSFCAGLPD